MTVCGGATVLIGCGGSKASVPACAVGRQLGIQLGQLQGATGAVAIPVGVRLGAGDPCRVDMTVTVSILHSGGVAPMRGNPQTWYAMGLLTRTSGPKTVFRWANACGDTGGYALRVRIPGGGGAVRQLKGITPRCDSPNSPPTLGVLPGSPIPGSP